jgi:hypothetical protein
MKNYFADNNYGIRFKSKTEAIEQLCLKVFGATPVYESSLEDLKEETLESMYAKVVSVALDCDPIAAKDRADDKLEPPWEVFARVKRERDIWIAEAERWRKNTDLYHTVLGQRDKLAEALQTAFRLIVLHHECGVQQELGCYCLVCHHKDGTEPEIDQIKEALAAVEENQKTDSISCPECDALASYGSNDGPCETHKL